MKTLLWLDDIRNPFLNLEGKVPEGCAKIIWARSYDEFTELIELFGLPDVISFDHDLADEHYTPSQYWDSYEASKAYQESREYLEKTGYDCTKWLVDYCADREHTLPRCYVHSANPVGADNIKAYLNNYIKRKAIEGLH